MQRQKSGASSKALDRGIVIANGGCRVTCGEAPVDQRRHKRAAGRANSADAALRNEYMNAKNESTWDVHAECRVSAAGAGPENRVHPRTWRRCPWAQGNRSGTLAALI